MSEKCVIKITDINGNKKDLIFNFADEVEKEGDVKKNTLSYLNSQYDIETDNGTETVQNFGSVFGMFYDSNRRKTIQDIELPDNITSIDRDSFCSLVNLRAVVIPKSVNHIDAYAFRYCWPEAVLVEKNSVAEKFFLNKEYKSEEMYDLPDVKIFYESAPKN